MEPFNELQICPKCLNKDIRMKYESDVGSPEWIKCTCKGCGHKWKIETADSDDEKKKDLIMEKE